MPRIPDIPDIPGKSLIGGTTKRARVVAAAAAGGALAVGGVVAKRVLGQGGAKDGDEAVAEPVDNVEPIAKAKPAPKAKAAKLKPAAKPKAASAAKPKAPKPKPASAAKPKPAAEPKPAKPKPAAEPNASKPKSTPAKPKAAKAKPAPEPKAETSGTDAPPKPDAEPGNRSHDKGPHQALNNPVGEPDETEYPDPYETRSDPRDPADPDGLPFGEEPHPATGSESTSEPPVENDPEQPGGGRPPRRDNLDQ